MWLHSYSCWWVKRMWCICCPLSCQLPMDFSIGLAEHPGLEAPLQLNIRILISFRVCRAESVFESSDFTGNCLSIEFEFWVIHSSRCEPSDIGAALWEGCLSHSWHTCWNVVSLPVNGRGFCDLVEINWFHGENSISLSVLRLCGSGFMKEFLTFRSVLSLQCHWSYDFVWSSFGSSVLLCLESFWHQRVLFHIRKVLCLLVTGAVSTRVVWVMAVWSLNVIGILKQQ